MIRRWVRFVSALTAFGACSGVTIAWAQTVPQPLRQMDHSAWTARDGAPQAINRLAQAADGTLWVGSDTGLYNFDGQSFRLFKSPAGQPDLPSAQVFSILVTKAGALWVGLREAGVARISKGRVEVFSSLDTEPLVLVTDLREAADGSIWALGNQRVLMRFGSDETWHREPTPSSTRGR